MKLSRLSKNLVFDRKVTYLNIFQFIQRILIPIEFKVQQRYISFYFAGALVNNAIIVFQDSFGLN